MENNPVSIVLVNYFHDDEVIHFIESQLFPQSLPGFEILVVDNGSENKRLENFCASQSRVHYFDPGNNLGYIGGFLFAFSKLKEKSHGLTILSNTDIEIEDRHLLEKISSFHLRADVAMLGPSVISSRTGHNQNPFYKERITLGKLKFLKAVFSSYSTYCAYQLLGMIKGKLKSVKRTNISATPEDVYAIHGSFMIFQSAFIGKYLDELKDAPFLFGEEIQFAETALGHEMKTLFVPDWKIIHHEHSTTQQFKSKKMLKYLKASIVFMIDKRRHS